MSKEKMSKEKMPDGIPKTTAKLIMIEGLPLKYRIALYCYSKQRGRSMREQAKKFIMDSLESFIASN